MDFLEAGNDPPNVAPALVVALLFTIQAISLTGGIADDGPLLPAAPSLVIPVNVTNSLSVPRSDEVVFLNITLPDSVIDDASNFTVRRQSDGNEVLSGPLNSTVSLYGSGFVHRMRIAFQDSFNASERKGYLVNIGERTSLAGDLTCTVAWPNILVTDGSGGDIRNYRIFIDNSYNYYTTGVRVYYNHTTYPYQAQSGILVRVAGDMLYVDQPSVQLGWGAPDSVVTDVNNVMVSVNLVYKSPYWIHWGVGMLSNLMRDTDLLWAVITVNIYNNRSMVDTFVSKQVNEKFYNHNGFVMETSILLADDGKYEYIYGTSNHVRMWTKTPTLNWTRDQTELVGLTVGNRSAPALGDLDGDGDLDMVVGSRSGNLTSYINAGSPGDPMFGGATGIAQPGPWDSNSIPDLGDLDGDGDLDMIIGVGNGTILALRNNGAPSSPVWEQDDTLVTGANPSPTSRLNAAPELADMDDDGDLDLFIGRSDGGFDFYRNDGTSAMPVWTSDDLMFAYLNEGNTRKPGTFTTPAITDVERDGLLDFVSGQNFTTFGSLIYFENTGTNSTPELRRLKPSVLGTIGSGVWWNGDYSVPEFGDLTGDGFEDIVMGINDGTLQLWKNTGYGWYERHVNEMQPLENGSYRFFYDNQGNDGQFVITNYSTDFQGWYVVSNPVNNASVFRYMPDFTSYVYRDRYSGEMYPWAGGNVSYYPFIPEEYGRVTRGILVSRANWAPGVNGYGIGASYLSQTGEAGGYVMVPVEPMNITSYQSLVMELPYDHSAALYDELALKMRTPLKIEAYPDLTLKKSDIRTDPIDLGEGMSVTITANVWNRGHADAANVDVEFFNGDPMAGGVKIGTTQTIPSITAGGTAAASVSWSTVGIAGPRTIFVAVDRIDSIREMDEDDNVVGRQITVTWERRIWSDERMISASKYNDMDPDIVADSNGDIWFAWHTFTTKENFDVSATSFDGTRWTTVDTIVENYKHTGNPTLAASPSGDVWLIFSSNKVEYDKYFATRHPMWYWSAKYDLYAAVHSGGAWGAPYRFTDPVEFNETDGAPTAAFAPDGKLWTAYRHTYYSLYFRPGWQIYNTPFQDENISARTFDGTTWSGEQIVDNRAGNQGWWGGANVAVSPSGLVWAIYESESGQQFDVYCSTNGGSGWSAPVRFITSSGQDVRPSVAYDSTGKLWVAWESDRRGNKDIFAKYFDGTTWSADIAVTTDLGEDIKPSLATDPGGNVYIVWEADRTGNKDIFMRFYNGTGWSPEIQVTEDPHIDENVKIAFGEGGLWLVWETDRNGYGDTDIYVKAMNIALPARGPSNLKAALSGFGFSDVRLSWNISADDWLYHKVTGYVIMCGSTYETNGAGYQKVYETAPGVLSFTVASRGHGDPDNLFCMVYSNSTAGYSAASNQAGAFKIALTGHNLISVPLIMDDTSASSVLVTTTVGPTAFSYVRYYDPTDMLDPWKIYSVAAHKELVQIDNAMGLWAGSTGPAQITVAGAVPEGYAVQLKAGWNMIGLPSLNTTYTVADLKADIGLSGIVVEAFDSNAAPYYLQRVSDTYVMMAGNGYWVYVSSDATWTIDG